MKFNFKSPKKGFSHSLYSCLVCILAVALAVGVNLFASSLPVKTTKLDTTAMGLHTLSDSTTDFVSSITDDIDIYLLCQKGEENTTVTDMLDRYADLNEKIHISTVDPAVNPDFAKQYVDGTVANNTIVVNSQKRFQVIEYSKIATYTAYKGEEYLNSALDYVTTDTLPVVYALTGHGEKQADSTLEATFARSGVQLKKLNLLSENAVPNDANAVFIYSPQKDLNDNEKSILLKYIENSGSLMLITDYNFSSLPNLSDVMAQYGVKAPDGIVVEGTEGMSINGYPYYILPQISARSEITKDLSSGGNYVLLPLAQAIEKTENARDTVKVTDLLTSSANSFLVDDSSSADASSSEQGPFSVGVSIEEKYDSTDSKIVWFTTSYLLDSDIDNTVGGTNSQLFVNSLNYLCGKDTAYTSEGKALSTENLTMTTSQSRNFKAVIIGIIPAAVLIAGAVVWHRRRNR